MEHIPPGSFCGDSASEGIGKREIMLGPCGQNYQEAANQCLDSYGHLVQLIILQSVKILTKYNCRLKSSLIINSPDEKMHPCDVCMKNLTVILAKRRETEV